VADATQVGDARRRIGLLAQENGADELLQGKVALVITELGTNLARHARGGQMLATVATQGPSSALQIIALDRGPGMHDIARCMADGYSTGGTRGTGLGAVVRQSDGHDLVSYSGVGTIHVCHFRLVQAAEAAVPFAFIRVPAPGELVCGDGGANDFRPNGSTHMLADGLGHGPMAAEAADEAVKAFAPNSAARPAELIRAIHDNLRKTRGAAVAVAQIDRVQKTLHYAGIGNIAGTIVSLSRDQPLVSFNGIVGHEMRRVQEFTHPWPDGAALVMHSDGLSARWDLRKNPGLIQRHPALLAATLFRDHRRDRDDATVLVTR